MQPTTEPNIISSGVSAEMKEKRINWPVTVLTLTTLLFAGLAVLFGVQYFMNEGHDSQSFPDSSQVSDAPHSDENRSNPVISATPPMEYNMVFTSGSIGYGDKGEFSLTLRMKNGQIWDCEINSIESKWVGDIDGGVVKNTSVLNSCSINGITGKIYKIVEIGEGHDALYDSVAFIMEDGSVEYLVLNDALERSDFNIKGKLDIDGFVIDAFTVGVGEEGAVGGYASTIFILSDGTYLKYDESMLK